MRIQWDAALVAGTAQALQQRFAGARIRAYHIDPVSRRLTLFLREATLVWDLHPTRLGMLLLEPAEPTPEARPLPARLTQVWSPPDDRVLVLETRRLRGKPPRGSIVVELFPNQENAVVTEGEDATVRALLRTREGERPLRRGIPYALPPTSGRRGAGETEEADAWWAALPALPEPKRRAVLLRELAWTSPVVAEDLLAEGGRRLWRALKHRVAERGGSGPHPGALILGKYGPQPYPISLPERTLRETGDLLDAFREAWEQATDGGADALLPGSLMEALASAVDRARGRAARLEEELVSLEDPDRLQGWGDLLLARFNRVSQGQDEAVLEGFDGEPVRIPLDPTLSPDANARRHYERAARVRRAREELPERIRQARDHWEVLETLLDRAYRGEATRDEVEAAVPEARSRAGGAEAGQPLPYRRFRSTGGREIRVGRGAARNDDLTFHHSRPDDIWLHARHAAGAHVILRWDGPGSPPPQDLEEAAVLAAVHSRARTSGTVPVDWTRRKHVRKPRKAPPGAVIPDQVKTVFVAPDETLAERLRDE